MPSVVRRIPLLFGAIAIPVVSVEGAVDDPAAGIIILARWRQTFVGVEEPKGAVLQVVLACPLECEGHNHRRATHPHACLNDVSWNVRAGICQSEHLPIQDPRHGPGNQRMPAYDPPVVPKVAADRSLVVFVTHRVGPVGARTSLCREGFLGERRSAQLGLGRSVGAV